METDGRKGASTMELFGSYDNMCVCVRKRVEDDRWSKRLRDLCVGIVMNKRDSLCV